MRTRASRLAPRNRMPDDYIAFSNSSVLSPASHGTHRRQSDQSAMWGHMQYQHWQVVLLVSTSILMVAAGAAAVFLSQHVLGSLVLIAGCCSVNYWRKPGKSWRRVADFAAAAPITIYVFVAGWGIEPWYGPVNIIGWSAAVICFVCYRQSFSISETTSEWWAPWHAGGHICLIVGTVAAAFGNVDRFLLLRSAPRFNPIALLGCIVPATVILFDTLSRKSK